MTPGNPARIVLAAALLFTATSLPAAVTWTGGRITGSATVGASSQSFDSGPGALTYDNSAELVTPKPGGGGATLARARLAVALANDALTISGDGTVTTNVPLNEHPGSSVVQVQDYALSLTEPTPISLTGGISVPGTTPPHTGTLTFGPVGQTPLYSFTGSGNILADFAQLLPPGDYVLNLFSSLHQADSPSSIDQHFFLTLSVVPEPSTLLSLLPTAALALVHHPRRHRARHRHDQ